MSRADSSTVAAANRRGDCGTVLDFLAPITFETPQFKLKNEPRRSRKIYEVAMATDL